MTSTALLRIYLVFVLAPLPSHCGHSTSCHQINLLNYKPVPGTLQFKIFLVLSHLSQLPYLQQVLTLLDLCTYNSLGWKCANSLFSLLTCTRRCLSRFSSSIFLMALLVSARFLPCAFRQPFLLPALIAHIIPLHISPLKTMTFWRSGMKIRIYISWI